MHQRLTVRHLTINALVAALYIALSLGPATLNLASGAIQCRISEGLNHLVVFNRKYIYGIVTGVFIFNMLFSSIGWLDMIFGTGQSLVTLLIVSWLAPKLPQLWQKMVLNTLLMTFSMFLIAIELHIALKLPFWATYGSTALSELFIMAVTAPIMVALDRVLKFEQRMK